MGEKIGVVQRIISIVREGKPDLSMASYCPYCKNFNTRPLELTLNPQVVECQKCHKSYIDSFQVKIDAEDIQKFLEKEVAKQIGKEKKRNEEEK